MIKCLLHTLTFLIFVCMSSLSHAALIVFTSQASFNAATTLQGIDTFAGFETTATTPSPINRTAGVHGYTGTAPGGFFGSGTTADPALSPNFAQESITLNDFTDGAQAIGGNFFDSNINGEIESGSLTVTAVDQSGTETRTIINASGNSFLGFVSSDSLVSLTLTSATADLFPTVDNLTIALRAGNPTRVPEPGSMALALAGFGMMGLSARRRRA